MNFQICVDRLNAAVCKLKNEGAASDFDQKIKFYCGQVDKTIAKVASKVVPQSKIALFAFEKTFNECGMGVVDQVKSENLKVVNFLFSERVDLSVENLCGTFNLPEDVRAVVVLDSYLYPFATYFATVRGIECVLIAHSLNVKGLLKNRLFIKNGDDVDEFNVSCNFHVIIPERMNCQKVDAANAFALLASYMVSLTDYRFFGIVTREDLNKSAYNLARSAILSTLNVIKGGEPSEQDLFFNLVLTEIADNLTLGRLFSCSAPSLAGYLYGCNADGGVLLAASLVQMELYSEMIEGDRQLYFAPEYGNRARKIYDYVGVDEQQTLKNYKLQNNKFAARKRKIQELYQKLKEEISKSSKILSVAMEYYFKLGGKNDYDLERLTDAVKLSGDLPWTINGMSLARESGAIKENSAD